MFSALRSFPREAWILFGGLFVNRFGSFVMPFLALYLTRRGYSIAQAGFAVGAYGGGHFLASMLGGHLADRIGRRNTIVLSMFSSAAAMLALSQARGYAVIIILTVLAGTATEMYRPASQALLTDLVPPDQRVMAFGMYRLAVNLGFAAGPATAGFLADHSFFLVFAGDAATSVGYGIIALVALPHGIRVASRGERSGEALRVARKDRIFLLFLVATVLITLVDFQALSTFALHVKASGFPMRVYGLLLSVNGLLIVCCELLITSVSRRFNILRTIALGYFLSGIGFALTGLATTIPALAATVAIWTLGEMIASPLAGAFVSVIAPENYRGRYMGLLAMAWAAGILGGPALGTLVFQRSPATLWAACGLLGTTSAAILLVLSRAGRHRPEPAPR